MKNRSRTACLYAAVAALAFTAATAPARDLTWDANGADAPLGADGDGEWNTSSLNWVNGDLTTGANVAWSNSPADSATFGNGDNAFNANVTPHGIEFSEAITVQNLTIGTAADGGGYNFSDFNGGSLTIAGNVTKTAGGGWPQFLMINGLTLTAGNHVFALRDTGADNAPELRIDSNLTGAGNLILDNGTEAAWGTLGLNVNNSYTGTTSINKGRLVISKSGALGATSAGTTIGDIGTLSLGGTGIPIPVGGLNLAVAEPITITRNTYSGGEYDRYKAAIVSANGTGTHTFTGPFVVDSTDARVQANSSTIVIASNVTQGPNVTAGVLTLDGDFAGFVTLAGNNTAFASAGGAIRIINGVEVNASSEANLGGATSKLILNGGTIHPTGALAGSAFMTNFGSHDLSGAPINTGVDVDAGQTFTVNGLSGIAIGMRGGGTLNFQGTNTFTGTPFFDGFTAGQAPTGVVNFAAGSNTKQVGLRLRSPVVNIAGTLDVSGAYTSIGVDTGGTNGTPDNATVNITGDGKLIQTTGQDFNISDNAGTSGTINVSDNGELTTGGITFLGKNNNTTGTINQSGGTININRGGNFAFVIADGRGAENPTGYYNLSGGSFTSNGEVYVGEGGSNAVGGTRAHGYWTQTGGTATIKNWFVVGREGAVGAFDMSGGVMNHTGGNMSLGDSNAGGEANTINVHGNAVITNSGEMWVGTGGGTVSDMKVYDTAQITTGNWFVVGRGGAKGTLDVYGNAVITKNGGNNSYVGESNAAVTSTMTVRDNAVFNATTGEFWVGQAGGVGILNLQDNASFSVNNWLALGRANANSNGTINLSGSASLTKTGGGYLAIGSGGTGTLNMTGGTLKSSGTRLGEASNGTMSITGGSATFTGEFSVGYQGNLKGTLNVGGNANVTLPGVVYGTTGSGTSGGSINLSGTATLTANAFTVGPNSTGARTFKFDGGTLKPAADSTNFIGGKITGVVSTGGANIDTNGKSVTVNSALTHDSALTGADGGLTKAGAGTLKLTGANTYTGNTTVSAGTLHATTPAALPGYTTPARVSVASGATLAVNAGGAGEWAATDIAAARASATFASGSALGIDTTNAAAPFEYDQVLPGPVGLTKTGAGTLKLTAANTYTGPTVLNGTGSVVLGSAAWAPVLTNAGGAVVNGDKLVFDYTSAASPAGTVASLLKSSHDSSNFRDPAQQIRTSNAADATHGLGYYDDGASSLIVMYTWYGDANLDGKVNADDYALTDRGLARTLTGWVNGDFDYSGIIDSADYLLIDTSFGLSGGTLSPGLLAQREAQFGEAYVSQLIAAVPEPTSLGLVGLGAALAIGRRRRRNV